MNSKNTNLIYFRDTAIDPETFRPLRNFRNAGDDVDMLKDEILCSLRLLARQLASEKEALDADFPFPAAQHEKENNGVYAVRFKPTAVILLFYPLGVTDQPKWERKVVDLKEDQTLLPDNLPLNAVINCMFAMPALFNMIMARCPRFKENNSQMMEIFSFARVLENFHHNKNPWWKRLWLRLSES